MKHLPSKYQPWVEARTRFHLSHALGMRGAFLVVGTVLASGCAATRVYLPAESCQRMVDGLRAELDSYQVPDTYRFVKGLAGFDEFRMRYAEREPVGDLGGQGGVFKVTGYSRTEAAMRQEYDALLTKSTDRIFCTHAGYDAWAEGWRRKEAAPGGVCSPRPPPAIGDRMRTIDFRPYVEIHGHTMVVSFVSMDDGSGVERHRWTFAREPPHRLVHQKSQTLVSGWNHEIY